MRATLKILSARLKAIRFAACVALVGVAMSGLVMPLAAQDYPVKPIKLISSQPPGSNGDVAGRLMAPKMGEILGQPVVFESRPGANGTIAGSAVVASPPDGYNILYVGAGTMVSNRFLMKNPPFDSVKDLTPISLATKSITLLTIHASLPPNNARELFDYIKKNPGKITYGSTGIGSPFHMMGETLSSSAGLKMEHVPYSGRNSSNAQNDLLTGRILLYFPSYTVMRPYIASGKVKVLAVMDSARYRRLPDLPALTEIVPTYKPVPSWNGFAGPAGLPQAIVVRLHAAIAATLADSVVDARLDELGIRSVGMAPEAFAKAMLAEIEDFAVIAKAIGLQPE
ncbi:MAG: Bug family tripartite tricarboxylate transporter substrate binding protein [Burkholderiales bacterium]